MHRGILLELLALRSPCGPLSWRLQAWRKRLSGAHEVRSSAIPPVGGCDDGGLFRRIAV